MNRTELPAEQAIDMTQGAGAEFRLGAGIDFTDPDSPLAPYYLHASHVIAVGLLGLLFVFFTVIPLWHTDIWCHMKFGQWIVEHGRLPQREPFCPFSDPRPDLLHSAWLSQTGYYLVYHLGELLAGGDELRATAGGVQLILLCHALMTVCRCLLLLAAFRRLGESLPLACAGLLVMLPLSPAHICVVRPQVAGELFFAAILLTLSRPLMSRSALLAVPLLMAMWANCHGSYLTGLALLAGALAGQALGSLDARSLWSPRRVLLDPQVRRLLLVLILSMVAIGLLNPDGPFIFSNTLEFARHPNLATMDEWKPLDFHNWRNWGGYQPYLISLLVIAVTQLLSPRWFSPTQLVLIAGFGVLPAFQQRMLTWWVMVVPWLLVPHWADIGKRWRWGWLHYRSKPSFRKTIGAAMLVIVAVVWSAPFGWLLDGAPRPLDKEVHCGTPWQLAALLKAPARAEAGKLAALNQALIEHYPEGRFTGCIFSTETQGDYLTWALPAEIPVLVYTHVHLFSPAYWQECMVVKNGQPGWQDVLDRRHANLLIFEPELHAGLRPLVYLDPAWQIVLDETGDPSKKDRRGRLLIALRKNPI
jgi:hypothetical protein